MENTVQHLLRPVRRRRLRQAVVRWALAGAVAAATVGIALAILYRWEPAPYLPALGLALLVIGPLTGALLAARRAPDWHTLAIEIDDRCQLQDRAQVALEFSACSSPSAFQILQVRDAVRRLESLDLLAAVPWRFPRRWMLAPVAYVAAAVLLAFLSVPPAVEVAAQPPDQVLDEANRLDEQARKLDQAGDELDSEELKQLAALMRVKAEEMRKPGVDLPEAMAKVSEIQAALAEMRKAADTTQTDQQLKELGAAVSGAKPLAEAGKALQELQLGKAAEALDKAKGAKFDPREAKATEDRIKQTAKQMESKGLKRLSKAAEKLADGVAGDKKEMDQGVKDLNQELKAQERRRRINQLMAQEQQRLTDCKNRCAENNRNLMQQRSHGQSQGQEKKPGDPQTKDGAGKGQRPPGADGKAAGKKAELDGMAGQGPSNVESDGTGPESPGSSRRVPREVYQKFQKQLEASIEEEHIPLGHRQTIRRYFELIRPPAQADPKSGPEPKSP